MCRPLQILFLLWLFCLKPSDGDAQLITLRCNKPLKSILRDLEKQADIYFAYQSALLDGSKDISIDVKEAPIERVMEIICKSANCEFKFFGQICSIRRGESQLYEVSGKVLNQLGEPIKWVTVFANQRRFTETDENGCFRLLCTGADSIFYFSRIGYEPAQVRINGQVPIEVSMQATTNELNIVSVVADGYKKNENASSGSYKKIDNELLNRRVSSFLMEKLDAAVSGLLISPSNGLPGSASKIQLRGQLSIGVVPGHVTPAEPMVIIDGIQLPTSFSGFNNSTPAMQAQSPLSMLNTDDIESIVILKDAEATAIYGSRGANGVVSIKTKKGKEGAMHTTVNLWSGVGWATRIPRTLSTNQYHDLRRQALALSGSIPSPYNAPDLTVWNTSAATDYRKELVQGMAARSNLHLAVSGGNGVIRYYVSAGHSREGSILPGDQAFHRTSVHTHLNHSSSNGKLSADLIATVTESANELVNATAIGLYLPPGIQANQPHNGIRLRMVNGISKAQIQYRLLPKLQFCTAIGFNQFYSIENGTVPAPFRPPSLLMPVSTTAYTARNAWQNWLIEPQLQYTCGTDPIKFNWLLGATLQQSGQWGSADSGNRYLGYFARLGLRFKDRLSLNGTIRRDGSSRLRAGEQFGTFGAVGVEWIVSKERFFKKHFPGVSYASLKCSYGKTGNDQIEPVAAITTLPGFFYWNAIHQPVLPAEVTGKNYSWEIGRKLEGGIELEVLKRVNLSATLYRNRVGNQVIGYRNRASGMPGLIAGNSSAVVQNQGLEIALQSKGAVSKDVRWKTNFVLTVPRNKLLSFPGLEKSSYAGMLVVGQSLSVLQGYRYTGVNPSTGLFDVADLNKDGQADERDYTVLGDLDPKLYGSANISVQYKRWGLSILVDGKIQKGYSSLYQIYLYGTPGNDLMNVPAEFNDRWRQPGDVSAIQRLAGENDQQATEAIHNFLQSDARLTKASYLRLKNVHLSYEVVGGVKTDKRVKACTAYLALGNLVTVTEYKGGDPETQNIFALPPLKTVVAGFQITF